jgi:single-strand DNA-binding protein
MGTNQNLAVLAGTITAPPVARALRSGTTVVQFDLATPIDGESISVPVAWHDPTPSQHATIVEGVHVVVVGSVRRRFFRVGGQTQSRTEVVASAVVPSRRTKSAQAAIGAAAEKLMRAGG